MFGIIHGGLGSSMGRERELGSLIWELGSFMGGLGSFREGSLISGFGFIDMSVGGDDGVGVSGDNGVGR